LVRAASRPKLINRTGLISASSLESLLTDPWSHEHQALLNAWLPRLKEHTIATRGSFASGFTKVGYALKEQPERDPGELAMWGILADYFDRTDVGVLHVGILGMVGSVELAIAYFNRRGIRFHWVVADPADPEPEGLTWSAGIGTEWLDTWWTVEHRTVLAAWIERIEDNARQVMAGRERVPGWHEIVDQPSVPGGYVPPWKQPVT
jgi:hypothetical protein